MKTFRLTAPITVTAYTEVEAETLEEAIKIACDRSAVVGGSGSGYSADEHWIVDDADGEVDPKEIHGGTDD